MLTFTLDGVEYTFDLNRLSLAEAMAVKSLAGLSVREYTAGVLYDSDPHAIAAMVYLAKRRAGEAVEFDELDFDVIDLLSTVRLVTEDDEPTETPDDEGAEAPVESE